LLFPLIAFLNFRLPNTILDFVRRLQQRALR